MPSKPAQHHWHISSIQVKAFKSFGPSWCSFHIPPGSHLVGLVGPNGCGKSNLLEAVCFAAAGSASVLRLSGRSLQDVTSTDAGSQRPEVRLSISQAKTTHTLEACLTADGRAYKIDGRIKTGTQVKEFLRARGIVVDSTTVIQQAAVTSLSDSNNAQALAQLVAAASGLNSWDQETAAARQEVSRTHKALKDIQGNITKVQSSVACEGAALAAAAEAAALEQQLEQQVLDVLVGLRQRQQQLEVELQDAQAEEQQLKGSEAVSAEQLQQLAAERQALATKQADVLAQLETHTGSSSGGSDGSSGSSSLDQRIAAAEAEVASLQAAIAARAALLADLQHKQQQLQQQEAQCELLQQRVAAKQEEADSLAANLAAVRSRPDAAAALQQQAREASMQAAAATSAAQQQRELLAARQQEVDQAGARLRSVQQQLQSLTPPPSASAQAQHASAGPVAAPAVSLAEAGYAVAAASAARAAASAAADSNSQQLGSLQQQLLKLQMQWEAAGRPLTPPATASLLALLHTKPHNNGSNSRQTVPLHSCFRLKDATAATTAGGVSPQQMEQLLTPLSVIAGPAVLQTLVAPSVAEANRVLAAAAGAGAAAGGGAGRGGKGGSSGSSAAGRRLKIWPLDNLSVHDSQQRQRAAQQQLGAQAVMLPLDFLEFDAGFRPALLRAFGGCVIAADDATAAAVVKQFGLSAVTLQGTVSRMGSMTGGWTGSSGSYARTFWGNKQRHDAAARQLQACQQQLDAVRTQQQQLEQQRNATEAALAAAQQRQQLLQEQQEAQGEVGAAVAAEQQAQQQLRELESRSVALEARLLQYQAALGQGLSTAADGGEGGDGDGGAQVGGNSRSRNKAKKQGGSRSAAAATATLEQQLQAVAAEAAAAAQEAGKQLEQAQDQVEELAACIEALECRLGGSSNTNTNEPQHQQAQHDKQQQQQQLQASLQALQSLQQEQEAGRAAADALRAQLQQLQAQQQEMNKQGRDAEQEAEKMQRQVVAAAGAVRAAAAAVQKLQNEHRAVVREFSGTDAVQSVDLTTGGSTGLMPSVPRTATAAAAAAGGDGVGGVGAENGSAAMDTSAAAGGGKAAAAAAPTDAQLQQLIRRARQLQAKLSKLDVPELLPGQQEALTARLSQVAAFNQQSDALREAAAGLEAQMAGDAEQVYAANDVVFEDVAAGFSQLCSSLLPSLELQLVRTGKQAHEGLQFRFRRLEDTTAADAAADAPADSSPTTAAAATVWHTNLGQLSGGQRTLVSLAMLLAVARTGSSCGLLLLDEVDAALDEVNQARASSLLKQLAHDGASACQILCVTHNSSFQERCDGFLRVTKSAAGHSVPAETQPGGSSVGGAAAGVGGKTAGRGAAAKGGGTRSKAGGQRGATAAAAAGSKGGAAKAAGSGNAGRHRAKRVRFEEEIDDDI